MASTGTAIGHRIVLARGEAGLTQVALAKLAGTVPRTVQAWERDERHPRPDALARLAQALGRPVAWFYEDTPSSKEAA